MVYKVDFVFDSNDEYFDIYIIADRDLNLITYNIKENTCDGISNSYVAYFRKTYKVDI